MRRIATLMAAGILAALVAPGSASAFFGPTGSFGGSGSGNGQFNGPRGVAVTGATVYVADTGNNRIEYFDTSGTFQNFLLNSPPAPTDVAAAAGTSVAAASASQVVHWTLGVPVSWSPPGISYGIAIDPSGNTYYVSDRQNGIIREYDGVGHPLSGTLGSQGTGPGQLLHPEGMTTDGAGNVYVADPGNSKVVKYTASGFQEFSMPTLTLYVNGVGTPARLQPHDVAVDASGRVFVADGNPQTNLVAMFGPGGDLQELFGSLVSDPSTGCPLSTPYGVSTSPSGALYVASTGENRIRTYGEAVAGCSAPYPGAAPTPAPGGGSGGQNGGGGPGGHAGKKGNGKQPSISFAGMPRHCATHNFQFSIHLTDDVTIKTFKLIVNGRKASKQSPGSTDWSVKVSMPVATVRRQLPKGQRVRVTVRVKARDASGRKNDHSRSFQICG